MNKVKKYKYQSGGRAPILVSDKNDPRLRAYQDSSTLYNSTQKALSIYNKLHYGKDFDYKDGNAVEEAYKRLNKPSSTFISKYLPFSSTDNTPVLTGVNIFKKPVQPIQYQARRIPPKAVLTDIPNQTSYPSAGNATGNPTDFFKLPEGQPVYGPSKSLIGVLSGNKFTPDIGNTANRTSVNQVDSDLLMNKDNLSSYLRSKGVNYQRGGYSTDGYKANSPDRNRKYNIIPSGRITMKNVNFPIVGTANTGEQRLMLPGEEHYFNGASQVKEVPLRRAQVGGTQLTDYLASEQGQTFEPKNNYVSAFDYDRNKMIAATAPVADKTHTINFNDYLAGIPAVSGILDAIATQVDNRKKTNQANSNLSNPLNAIPYDNNTNTYYQKGTPTFDEGGQFNDEFDQFLFDDSEDNIDTPDQNDQSQDVQPQDTPDQTDQSDAVQLDEYTPDDFSVDDLNTSDSSDITDSTDSVDSENNYTPSSLSGDRESSAFSYLVNQKGLSPHIAAGIVGNLVQESSVRPDSVDNTGAYGIAQWMGSRKQGLFNYAKSKGVSPSDINTQLDYLTSEPGESDRALSALRNTRTPAEAALVWANTYERPNRKYANYNRRISSANKIHQQYLNSL